jgi:predicted transporter
MPTNHVLDTPCPVCYSSIGDQCMIEGQVSNLSHTNRWLNLVGIIKNEAKATLEKKLQEAKYQRTEKP